LLSGTECVHVFMFRYLEQFLLSYVLPSDDGYSITLSLCVQYPCGSE
jgi:hypothetical protein